MTPTNPLDSGLRESPQLLAQAWGSNDYLSDDMIPREVTHVNPLMATPENVRRNPSSRRELSRLRFQLEHAATKGLISVDQARNFMEAEDHNWMDRLLHLEDKGSFGQSIIDVLCAGNYLTASLAKATLAWTAQEDEVVGRMFKTGELSGYSIGISTQEFKNQTWGEHFKDAWTKRTTFKDVYGYDFGDKSFGETLKDPRFLKSLASDIFLDPVTYLTFGVGSLTKVGVSKVARNSIIKRFGVEAGEAFIAKATARATVHGGQISEFTLGRWGSAVYETASRDMIGDLAQKTTAANIAARAAGESELIHGGVKLLTDFHEEVLSHMIKNYDDIARRTLTDKLYAHNPMRTLVGKVTKGAVAASQSPLKTAVAGGAVGGAVGALANPDDRLAGGLLGAAAGVGAGVGLQKLHGPMAAYPPIEDMFIETARLGRQEMGLMKSGQIGESLSKVTKYVPRVDNFFRAFDRTWGMDAMSRTFYNAYRGNVAQQSAQWLHRTSKAFGAFTEEERKAASNLLEDGATDLVARNAATSIARTAELSHSPRVVECARIAKGMFDEIAEEEQKYGLLGDSINDYVTHFYKNSKMKHVIHSMMRNSGMGSSGNPFSMHRDIATLARAAEIFGSDEVLTDLGQIVWMRKKASIDYISRQKFFTQMQVTHGLPAAIREASKAGMDRHLMNWLVANADKPEIGTAIDQVWQSEAVNIAKLGFVQGDLRTNRKVIEFLTGTARNYRQGFVTDSLRTAKQMSQTVRVHWRHAAKDVKISDLLDSLYDDAPLALSKQEYVSALTKLDDELRERGIPLLAVFPDIVNQLARKTQTRAVKGVLFKSLTDNLNRPIAGLRMAAQLPEDVVARARVMRQKIGDFTDVVKPHPHVMREVDDLVQKIGFKVDEVDELLDTLFGRKGLGSLSARQAEAFKDYLTGWVRPSQTAAQTITGKPGKAVSVWDPFLRGEPLVRFAFAPWKKTRVTNFGDVMDDVATKVEELSQVSVRHETDLAAAYSKLDSVRKAVEQARSVGTKKNVREWILENVPSVRKLRERRNAATAAFEKAKADVDQGREMIKRFRESFDRKIAETIADGAKPNSKAVKAIRQQRKQVLQSSYASLKKLRAKKAAKYPGLQDIRKLYREGYADAIKTHEPRLLEDFGRILTDAEAEANAAKSTIESAWHSKRITGQSLRVEKLRKGIATAKQRLMKTGSSKDRKAVAKLERRLHNLVGDNYAESILKGDDIFVKPSGEIPEQIARTARNADELFPAEHLGGQFVKGMEPVALGGDVYYFPASIANLLDEVSKSDMEVSALLRGYDFIQNLFKAPLMAPHVAFFKRNAVTNVALNSIRCGLSLLHPGHARDYTRAIVYYIANEGSNLAKGTTLIKSAAKAGGATGAVGGAIGGAGYAATHEDVGFLEGVGKGALLGAVGGAGFTAATGAAMQAGLKAAPAVLAVDEYIAKGVRGIGDIVNVDKIRQLGDTHINMGGNRYTIAEWIDEAEKHGVFWTHVSKELFPTGMASTKAQVIGMTDLFRSGELLSETPTRLMLFTTVAKETGSFAKAGQAVKDYLFDYSNLSIVERRVMRRMIPFYSWVRHALTVSYNSVIEHPGRFTAQWKFVQNSNPDIDPTSMPDWLSNRMKRIRRDTEGGLVVRANFGLAHEDALDLVTGVGSVAKYVAGAAQGNTDPDVYDKALRLLSRGPFGITSAVELAFNKESYTGNVIMPGERYDSQYSPAQYRNAAHWLQAAVGYKKDSKGKETINPFWAWLMGEIPHSRFINMARQLYETDEFDHQSINYEALARRLLSENVYRYDPKQQRYYQDRARIEQMTLALKNLGLARTWNMTTFDQKKKAPKIVR